MELKLGGLKLADGKVRIALGFAVCVLVAVALNFSQLSDSVSRKILDRQFAFLRDHYPHSIANDVVIVGIDEATFKVLKEPYALWHPHFGKFLQAMSRAKPSVLGVDVALPERSYDFLIRQYDQNLTQGLLALKAQTPIVLGQTLDENGNFRLVFPPFVEASGTDGLAPVVVCAETDGVARRADPNQCTVNTQGATLTEAMAAHLGRKQAARGLVDFRVGDELNYVPFHKVLEWADQWRRRTVATYVFGQTGVARNDLAVRGSREFAGGTGGMGAGESSSVHGGVAGAGAALDVDPWFDPGISPRFRAGTEPACGIALVCAFALVQIRGAGDLPAHFAGLFDLATE